MFKYGWSAKQNCHGHVGRGGFKAVVIKFERYHYGKHTAYGERTVWKEYKRIKVGDFETRAEAIKAAKAHIKKIEDDNAALMARPGPSIADINTALEGR